MNYQAVLGVNTPVKKIGDLVMNKEVFAKNVQFKFWSQANIEQDVPAYCGSLFFSKKKTTYQQAHDEFYNMQMDKDGSKFFIYNLNKKGQR